MVRRSGIEWAPSAAKHGIDRADVLNAVHHAYWRVEEFDEPRVPGGVRPDLFIGPARSHRLGDLLIEVMLERRPPAGLFIFHAMPARRKFMDQALAGDLDDDST
ncbi:MAG: hypothetical protein ACRC35_03185 [Angustibacter sp.]